MLKWAVFFVFLASTIFFGIKAAREARSRRQFRRVAVPDEAVVIGHRVSGSPRGSRIYYVTYHYNYYNYEGKAYQREENVTFSVYQAFPRGEKIPIRYLPGRPYSATIEGNDPTLTIRFMLAALIATLIAGVIAVGWL